MQKYYTRQLIQVSKFVPPLAKNMFNTFHFGSLWHWIRIVSLSLYGTIEGDWGMNYASITFRITLLPAERRRSGVKDHDKYSYCYDYSFKTCRVFWITVVASNYSCTVRNLNTTFKFTKAFYCFFSLLFLTRRKSIKTLLWYLSG